MAALMGAALLGATGTATPSVTPHAISLGKNRSPQFIWPALAATDELMAPVMSFHLDGHGPMIRQLSTPPRSEGGITRSFMESDRSRTMSTSGFNRCAE